MDIKQDPGCCRTMSPDTIPHYSLGSDVVDPHDSTIYLDYHGPDVSVALKDQHGLRCLTRVRSCTQPLVVSKVMHINTAAVGTLNQTWLPSPAQAKISSWPLVATQDTQINMASVPAQALDTKMATGSDPHPVHPHGLGGNMGQLKPWLLQTQIQS